MATAATSASAAAAVTPATVGTSSYGLATRRPLAVLAFAAAVWFGAALFVRYAGPYGIFTGWRAALLYLATVPATLALNHRVGRIAGVGCTGLLEAVALGTALATMLDGVAMTWAPGLYGGDPRVVGPGAAWLLFAVGVGLALAALAGIRAGARARRA